MKNYFNINNYRPYLTLNIFNSILFLIILIVGVYTVTVTNDLAVKGYAITELKTRSTELKNEHQEKEIRVAQLKSYNYLSELIEKEDYVAANDIEYIIIDNKETVAMK